jgi:purine nucleoside phosphorylase
MQEASIGIIGGSGLYQVDALDDVQAHDIDKPFGQPSDQVMTGTVHGVLVAFLARTRWRMSRWPSRFAPAWPWSPTLTAGTRAKRM